MLQILTRYPSHAESEITAWGFRAKANSFLRSRLRRTFDGIASVILMPGCYRYSLDLLLEEVAAALELGDKASDMSSCATVNLTVRVKIIIIITARAF